MFDQAFTKKLNLRILPEEKAKYQPLFLQDVYDKNDAVDKYIRERFRPAILEEKSHYIAFEEVETLLAELQNCGLINVKLDLALLKSGTDTNRYRIGYSGKSNAVVLAFRFGENQWVKLGTFDEVGSARIVASQCQQFLYAVNRFGEGMHVFEDSFLNRISSNKKQLSRNSSENYQVRVVLPRWVVRFESRDFQIFVETLLQQSCPAHIYCNFYWLTFENVNTFERCYENWHRQYLKSMNSVNSSLELNVELDNAQSALTDFFTKMDDSERQSLEKVEGKHP